MSMSISGVSSYSARLFDPNASIIPKKSGSIVDLLPQVTDPSNPAYVLFQRQILLYKRQVYYQIYLGPNGETNGVGDDYRKYLQIGNPQIQALVSAIVSPGDDNDAKAQKILDWVISNITYKTDLENYGLTDYWALPTQTLNKKAGECKGGAFLIHAMMLASGIPPNRIKTVGGVVLANGSLGGHAWTMYKREYDNQWIDLDWCYYAEQAGYPIEQEVPIRTDDNYQDVFFTVTVSGTKLYTNTWGIPETVYKAYQKPLTMYGAVDTYA